MKRFLILAVITSFALTAACGSDDESTVGAGGAKDAGHNDADIAFAQGMIPHHEQAVEMSDMAFEKAESAEVKDLATRIKAAQAPEIEMMRGWLKDWGKPVEEGAGHSMGGGSTMGGSVHSEGMMSDGDMKALESSSGASFDKLFLEGMIEHHKGAVAQAQIELDDGEFADAKALAQAIIEAQEKEITEMEGLL